MTIDSERTTMNSARIGDSVLDALARAGMVITGPCGGLGKCGKCRVMVRGGVSSPTAAELRLLTRDELAAGVRLACQAHVTGDIDVKMIGSSVEPTAALAPADPMATSHAPNHATRSAHPRLTDLAVALDIGTTTLAAYLVHRASGSVIDTECCLNPQSSHGADVMSRIAYSGAGGGLDTLRGEVVGAVDALISTLARRSDARPADIRVVGAVGNTCMHHLFLGIPVGGLGVAPYSPVVLDTGVMRAASAGLASVSPDADFFFLPNVAGFVGSDSVAVALAVGLDQCSGVTLAIDVGTNGEILLAAGGRILACSTAAGPAFEGAQISHGMIAVAGAIDRACITGIAPNCDIDVRVIGGGAPRGICGSGVMSIVAALREAGIISEYGAFVAQPADDCGPLLARRFAMGSQGAEVLLSDQFEPDDHRVALTQRDIRELQLAKAAIRAGIAVMLDEAGITYDNIESVALAGAFGSYMDPAAAVKLGLLPPVPLGRIRPVGNAAGAGAVMAVSSRGAYDRARQLSNTIEHIDLASSPVFGQVFIDSMLLAEM